jgi:tetratricopeptide (TPR) repeat protein
MTTDLLSHLQKLIQAYYERLECKENALLTCPPSELSSIKQEIICLSQEIIPAKKDYWVYWGTIGTLQLEIADVDAAVINAEIAGEVEMLRFQPDVQYHGEVISLLDRIQTALTSPAPAAGKLKETIPLLPEFLEYDTALDTEGLLRRVFPIFANLDGRLTKELSSFGEVFPIDRRRGQESVFHGQDYAGNGSQLALAPKRLFGSKQIRRIPEWVGRDKLLAELHADCLNGRRAIALWGQSGIGKTSLAVKLMESCGVDLSSDTLPPTCSYDNALYCGVTSDRFDFLTEQFLDAFGLISKRAGATPTQIVEMILTKLQQERWLIVIDNLEPLLDPDTSKAKSPEVGELINRLAYGGHKSQIIITSRKFPTDLVDRQSKQLFGITSALENRYLIRTEAIRGIATSDRLQLLQDLGADESQRDLEWIADRVKNNIFVLKPIVARSLQNPGKLRKEPILVTDDALPIVRAQWEAQSPEARDLLQRMCVLREAMSVKSLTTLRLLQPDGVEVEWSEASDRVTAGLLADLVKAGLVEYAYDWKLGEHLCGLHRLTSESLQTISKDNLEQLWRYAAKLYNTLVGVLQLRPVPETTISEPPSSALRSLEDLGLVLEEWHFCWLLGKYEIVSKMAVDFLRRLDTLGYWSLQQEWCDRILPHTEGVDRRYCLETLGRIYRDTGRWDEAENYFKLSLADAEQTGGLGEIATSSEHLAGIAQHRQEWTEAEALYQKALRLHTELGNRVGVATTWGELGAIARQRSNWAEAEILHHRALKLQTELGDGAAMATSLNVLGDIARQEGNWDQAELFYRKSLRIRTEFVFDVDSGRDNQRGMATAWSALGDLACKREHYDEAEALYHKSLKLYTDLADREGMATNWMSLGDIARNRGNWDEAEALYQKSLRIRTELGDGKGMATAWSVLGSIAYSRGNWDEAETLHRKSLKLHTELGNGAGMATACGVLGDIARNRGNWDEAEIHQRKALKLHTELEHNEGMASAWCELGSIAQHRKNWAEAEIHHKKSLKLHTELGNASKMAATWGILGSIAYSRGNWTESESLFHTSLKLHKELGDRVGMATTWSILGDIARNQGKWTEAETLFHTSLNLRAEIGDRLGMASIWSILGDIAHEQSNLDEAETLYRKSLRLHTELGDGAGMATAWRDLGDIAHYRHNWDEAEILYRKSLKLHTELGDGVGMATAWGALGDIAHHRHNWDEAESLYQKCLRLYTKLEDEIGIATTLGDLGKNELSRGNLEAAKILLLKALPAREKLKMTGSIAETNWDLSRLYRAQGDEKRAQGHYTTARNLYHQLGAKQDLEQIDTEWLNNTKVATTAAWKGIDIMTRYFPKSQKNS